MLITVDGVRWQEIFRGVDPALARRAGLPGCAVLRAEQLIPELHRLVTEGMALGAPDRGQSAG